MIDSQRGAKRQVGYNHLISNKREWNNCFITNHQQILPVFGDFAWLEQPEGNLMDATSRVWYNGSYTIAAKPIKTCNDPVFNNWNYPTALSRVQITPKTSINITRICSPEDRLDRFPAVDQSVSWISRANSVSLSILVSRISHK